MFHIGSVTGALIRFYSFCPLSESSDDSGIVSYLWEQVDGPLWNSDGPMNTSVLKLQNIPPGDYTFRCKVHILISTKSIHTTSVFVNSLSFR